MTDAEFFAPDTTYIADDPYKAPEIRPEFRCVAVAVHPTKGEDRAFGFWRPGAGAPWVSQALNAGEWAAGWVPVPRPPSVPILDYDDGLGDLGCA